MPKHDLGNMEYQHFLNIIIDILNKHAPMKQKYHRANQGRFMTKDLHKAIMKRSRLRNKFLRDRTDISREEYKKQRNLCVSLLKKAKQDHFANLDIKSVTDNKKFWQTVKPLFSNKVKAKTVSNELTICSYHVTYAFSELPQCRGTPCSKQAPNPKFK